MANAGITQDEAEIYDRQIRLWGLEAQQSIRAAHVLIVGLNALSNEVCKNIALAGIGSLTLLDHAVVQEENLGAQFLLKETDIGKNRAEAAAPSILSLNPRVDIIVDKDDVKDKPDTFFQTFDIVCVAHGDIDILLRIDHLRRQIEKPFYAADAFGWFGYIFCDLTKHAFIEERKTLPPGSKSTAEPVVTRTKQEELYTSLEESLRKDWSSMTPKALKKRVSPVSFLIHCLFKFQQEHKRVPGPEDSDLLVELKPKYLQNMGISDASVLDDALIRDLATLFETEMAPVAAILGGVLAQEMIKVLSKKELPIQNWFYYEGLNGSGLIHRV
ncbi:hypothetical protein BCR43DRAFT_492212 [Syncephalastrum racemosum]|uniref:Ubiquitin-like 1-activating enzyme E1A n=1 Tax=Syncephalastrum racemosum TaxID=13706 RepID=A0A1X2HD75_SYNRA|nr:hypothetical protein BCR43DRAFT_492212 [Syncephalastrum racemosum]